MTPHSPLSTWPDSPAVRAAAEALEAASAARARAVADDDAAVFEHAPIVAAAVERLREARLAALEE